MEIKKAHLIFAWELTPLKHVDYIVLHHAAGSGSVQAIHDYHKNAKGWAGIAYHLYVRKDGSVWQGRPIDKAGGHCSGYNYNSVGICFEGNFTTEYMTETQLQAGKDAVIYCRDIYPSAKVVGHKELTNTICPGQLFPLEILKGAEEMSGEEIFNKLQEYCSALPLPDWAKNEIEEAKALGITDGENLMQLIPRYQAAIMAKRAAKEGR